MKTITCLSCAWTAVVLVGATTQQQRQQQQQQSLTTREMGAVLAAMRGLRMVRPVFVCAGMEKEEGAKKNVVAMLLRGDSPARVVKGDSAGAGDSDGNRGSGGGGRSISGSSSSSRSYAANLIICEDRQSLALGGGVLPLSASARNPWLVVERGATTVPNDNGDGADEPPSPPIQVNHKVYFLDLRDLAVAERYVINGVWVRNVVGSVDEEGGGGTFRYSHREDQGGFLRRRSANFHGLSLRAMTENDGLYVKYNTAIKAGPKEDWTPDRMGQPIKAIGRDQVAGLFIDVLGILESDMNFTTELLIRRDGAFGHLINGTWFGMVANVLGGDADFICTGMAEYLMRVMVMDYLYRLGTQTPTIFIGRKGLEEHAWLSFLYPLTTRVWIFLLINTFLLLGITKFLQLLKSDTQFWNRSLYATVEEVVGDFWILGAAYFGGKPRASAANEGGPLKVVFFVAFFSGTLVFMSYRSSLTAELAITRDSIPFETLDQLYESDFRYSFKPLLLATGPVAILPSSLQAHHSEVHQAGHPDAGCGLGQNGQEVPADSGETQGRGETPVFSHRRGGAGRRSVRADSRAHVHQGARLPAPGVPVRPGSDLGGQEGHQHLHDLPQGVALLPPDQLQARAKAGERAAGHAEQEVFRARRVHHGEDRHLQLLQVHQPVRDHLGGDVGRTNGVPGRELLVRLRAQFSAKVQPLLFP